MQSNDPRTLREHGYPPSGEPIERPTWEPAAADVPNCPNCDARVAKIEVLMKNDRVRGGVGTGRYFGCPACPWASPAIVTTLGNTEQA